MAPFSLQLNLSPSRYRAFISSSSRTNTCRRRTVRSPRMVSHPSLSPKTTPSPKRKARSSASTSVFTSLISALKLKSKGKKPAQKLPSPARPAVPISPNEERHAKPGLQRACSVPVIGTQKHITRRQRNASSNDSMEVDSDEEVGKEVCPTQYLYYDVSENPFATPPCTPATPLSPMMLDNDVETPASSPDSTKSRKRRAVERSRMKTLQFLGPEAHMAISEQYGDVRRWEV
ncbi:hypothetical protein C0995_016674 [Termitomyces sp. Mi166|nr:hypothetical protein C0995_016674 [Termitomyces sp. Mi166\